jgi:hypothetical protein
MMGLAAHVQNHLVVAYVSLRDLVEEMETIATRGVARSGTGRRLTPLPPGEWERMAAPLHRIVDEARVLAERHAPERLAEYETRAPLGQTRSWLSIQTGRLEDALRDLRPERLARFGALDPAFTADLDERLSRCQAEIDALRNKKGTEP